MPSEDEEDDLPLTTMVQQRRRRIQASSEEDVILPPPDEKASPEKEEVNNEKQESVLTNDTVSSIKVSREAEVVQEPNVEGGDSKQQMRPPSPHVPKVELETTEEASNETTKPVKNVLQTKGRDDTSSKSSSDRHNQSGNENGMTPEPASAKHYDRDENLTTADEENNSSELPVPAADTINMPIDTAVHSITAAPVFQELSASPGQRQDLEASGFSDTVPATSQQQSTTSPTDAGSTGMNKASDHTVPLALQDKRLSSKLISSSVLSVQVKPSTEALSAPRPVETVPMQSSLRKGQASKHPKSTVAPTVRFLDDHPRLSESDVSSIHAGRKQSPVWEQVVAAFPQAMKRRIKPTSFGQGPSGKRQRKKVSINIGAESRDASRKVDSAAVSAVGHASALCTEGTTPWPTMQTQAYPDDILQPQPDLEDALSFFAETHEDQDPDYIQLQVNKRRKRLEDLLAGIDIEADRAMQEIESQVAAQLKEKQESHDRTRQALLEERASDYKRQQQRVIQAHNARLTETKRKLYESTQHLLKAHKQETQQAMNEHDIKIVEEGSASAQAAKAEWATASQRFEAREKQEIDAYKRKLEEMKQQVKAEMDQDLEKLRIHYEAKVAEKSAMLEKMLNDAKIAVEEQKTRRVKRHQERFRKQRDSIRSKLREINSSFEDFRRKGSSRTLEALKAQMEQEEFSVVSPITLGTGDSAKNHGEPVGALLRKKHRSKMLSSVPRQLLIEIHNEGIWISSLLAEKDIHTSDTGDPQASRNAAAGRSRKTHFVPWGLEAQSVLQSVSCGEVPPGYGIDLASSASGLVRCQMLDLRCSESVAREQRASGMREHETSVVEELEMKAAKLSESIAAGEKAVTNAKLNEKDCISAADRATKDLSKAEQTLQKLRIKASDLLGEDDAPVPTMDPSERKKLSQTMHVLKANVETASNRHDAAQKALLEAKDHAQKIQKVQQQTQRSLTATTSSIRKKKASALERSVGLSRSRSRISDTAEAERASDRVKDVISSLYRVSALRRGQLQSKRYGAALLDDISGLPVAVKRSLKLRTGLRRQTIMLRPNLEDTLGKLKKSVENVPLEESYSAADAPGDVILRAEQLFLLAAHPVFESKNVAPVPPVQKNRTSLPWAEPGSHIDLSVPKDIVASSSLLPVAPAYSLLQQNICENLSSQGRQMATNFRPSQVAGGLQQSLTVLGQLTSTAPIVGQDRTPVVEDPLSSTEAEMMAAYTFTLKSPGRSASSYARKRNSAKNESDPIVQQTKSTATPVKKRESPTASVPTRRRVSAKTDDKAKRSRSKAAHLFAADSMHLGVAPREGRSFESLSQPINPPPRALSQAPGGSPAALMFGQRPASLSGIDQQAAHQYGPSFLTQSPPEEAQHASLQHLQTRQLQQALPSAQRQLLMQHQQFPSPQHLRQLAQLRMLQQQQLTQPNQSSVFPNNLPQSQLPVQFFSQMIPPPQQNSFPGQQPAQQGSFPGQQPPQQGSFPGQQQPSMPFPHGQVQELPPKQPFDPQSRKDSTGKPAAAAAAPRPDSTNTHQTK